MKNEEIRPVKFRNHKDLMLSGILHVPVKNLQNTAILLLSPGEKNRVAPHRLYVKMAQQFSSLGFPVLRFDPEGLGDSEGEIDVSVSADLYGTIQMGRFVQDTVSAMDWIQEELGIHRFILSGLCGGAITGLLTGAQDDRVLALHGLGIPVILDSSDIDSSAFITMGQLKQMKKMYLTKMFTPSAWLRFLTFQTDYRLLAKSFFKSKNEKLRKVSGEPNVEHEDNFNHLFLVAFTHMVSRNKKLQLIFSGSDRLYSEFKEKFLPRAAPGIIENELVDIHIVADANHIFTFSEWQKTMLDLSSGWLQENFIS